MRAGAPRRWQYCCHDVRFRGFIRWWVVRASIWARSCCRRHSLPVFNVFPDEIVRTLSYHGPVDVFVGTGTERTRGQVGSAPFEDVLHLFVPAANPLEKALLGSSVVEVQARHEAGEYVIRMTGRAHAGQTLARHPDRNVLQPWVQTLPALLKLEPKLSR